MTVPIKSLNRKGTMFGLWRKPCVNLPTIVGRFFATCLVTLSLAGATPMTEQLDNRIHSLNLQQLGNFYRSV